MTRKTLRYLALSCFALTAAENTSAWSAPALTGLAQGKNDFAPLPVQWPGSDSFKKSDAPSNPGVQLKMPSDTPPAPKASGPAPAPVAVQPPTVPPQGAPGTASVSNVTIVSSDITFTIKSIDMTGTPLSNQDLAALLDPKSAEPLGSRLQKLTAQSVSMPLVTSDRKAENGTSVHAEYSQIKLSNVTNGVIGNATVAGVTVDRSDKNGNAKIGAIEASNLDLVLLDRLMEVKRSDDSEPLKPLAGAFAVRDISMTDQHDKTNLTIASITGKSLSARPLKDGFDKSGKDESSDAEDSKSRDKRAFEDLLSSFEAGGVTVETFTLATTSDNEPLNAHLGHFSFENLKNRKLGAISAHDFGIGKPGLKFVFSSFDAAELALPSGASSAAAALPSLSRANLDGLVVDVETPATETSEKSHVKFALAHFGSTVAKAAGQFASQSTATLDHLTFDLPEGKVGATEMRAMGYNNVDLSAIVNSTFDPDATTLQVKQFDIKGVNLGTIALQFDFSNVTKGIFSSDQTVQKASALAVLLKRIDLRLENAGLFDKVIALRATQDGVSLAQEKATAQALFGAQLPMLVGNDAGVQRAGLAIAKFIEAPKNLHIGITAKDGLGVSDMSQLNDPAAILRRLDITAEANQ